jgi:serine carboxypeptidase-like clade I
VGNRTAIARRARAAPEALRARIAASGPADANCFGSGPTIESWANTAAVKAALHVAPAINFELCSGNFSFNYDSDMADERTLIYPTLLTKANITAVIFNGEADLCVPFTDNDAWTQSMGYAVTADWAPWEVLGDHGLYIGGYRVKYEHGLTFVTVRGGGHMVSETRPEPALALFERTVLGNGV